MLGPKTFVVFFYTEVLKAYMKLKTLILKFMFDFT